VARKSLGDDYIVENPFGPSKAEQKQTLRMFLTIAVALLILGVGVLLRFTVFAEQFKPKTFTPPVASPSPSPTAEPSL
jgi:hypothetical protein